jgi:hypothetical protein
MEQAIIFTEACYGANPYSGRPDDSMALSAIQQGCALYIGSSNTSYASFAAPLVAADLLAALFWKAIASGQPGGAALQQAKVELAQTVMDRTGFLDVEEQKTLTSFYLYGDPALPLLCRPNRPHIETLRQLVTKTTQASIYQISGKALPRQAPDPTVLDAVRHLTEPFLQGTRETLTVRMCPLVLTNRVSGLNGSHLHMRAKHLGNVPDQWHVTVSKTEREHGIRHSKIVTMMVAKGGKVLRTHVSR